MIGYEKKKLAVKEFVFIPIILLALIFIVAQLHLIFDGFSSNIFFPVPTSILNNVKIIFTSVIILILLEFFLLFDIPDNLLISRTLSIIASIATFIGLSLLCEVIFKRENLYLNIALFVVAIYLGQIVSYFIKRIKKIKYSNLISIILIVMLTIASIYLTYKGINF